MKQSELTPFNNPSEAQQDAWSQYNEAIGALALSHNIDADELWSSTGTYTEEIISVLRDGQEPA